METFIVKADLLGFKSRINHTFDLQFNTNELQPEQAVKIIPFLNKEGTLAFKAKNFTDAEIAELPEVKPEFSGQKSPSERLKNVLFVYFRQQGGDKKDFEVWRIKEMESIINQYKDKLAPE